MTSLARLLLDGPVFCMLAHLGPCKEIAKLLVRYIDGNVPDLVSDFSAEVL
jgi:hypothetical protein